MAGVGGAVNYQLTAGEVSMAACAQHMLALLGGRRRGGSL